MDFLRKQIDKIKPHFEKGGKYEKFAPAFGGIETFLYVPNHTTKTGAHIRDGVDLKRVMMIVVLALVPALLFGTWNIGYQNLGDGHSFWEYFSFGGVRILPMIIISYGVGLGIEFAYAIFRGHSVNEGYLVTGLLIPLIMPIDMPLWMLTISVIFAVIIGKEAFGGTGMNILNPALVARAFALFSYAPFMSGNTVWVADSVADGVSGETLLGTLGANQMPSTSVYDMFMGFMPGSVGETSVLMILIGAAFLLFTGIASWRIMISSIIGASIMGFIFNLIG
ncbi:MAG: RnfABCDGE type electron transport complex subunit D, partial [Flavobacteriaceae bacterium]|nr:RnfABCDGE type electron transport complex subunit D [Flavobacteriaceae bacterium]